MAEPLVSVVTPSFNQAEFIEDTIRSVKNQRHGRVEHVVVDGGSTDGTLEVLRRYEDEYPLEWVSEPDDGQSHAINKGFDRATGDVVGWLNSDDVYFDTGVFSRVARYFEEHSADVIYGDLAYIDGESTVTEIDVRPDFDATKLPYRILIGQPATFFRREVVEEERLDTDLHYVMDYEFWLRLARTFEIEHVRDVLAGFRAYDEQKSQDREALAAELKGVFEAYDYPDRSALSVLLENGRIEAVRLLWALEITYRIHRDPPELAFDGRLAPLPTMLANVGPSPRDARKVWRRFRSRGTTG